jgi:hypothetical protein
VGKIDVDREALMQLERRMFENTQAAGPAGNHQWGIDVGPHQDRWDPYADTPQEWINPNYQAKTLSENEVFHCVTCLTANRSSLAGT